MTSYLDRHGVRRYRFRRTGWPQHTFKAHPSSPEGQLEYAAILERQPVARQHMPGTVAAAIARYCASPAFMGRGNDKTRHVSRMILDRFAARWGMHQLSDFRFDHIEHILHEAAESRVEKGRRVGGAYGADNLRKRLTPFFRWALRVGLIDDNPMEKVETPRTKRIAGFHTWSDAEIAAYRAHHALGTTPRLALELMLWTMLRVGDAAAFKPGQVRGGQVHVAASKTGKQSTFALAPQLRAAIDAMPAVGMQSLIVTAYGKPFTAKGLSNAIRRWCDDAGLPKHCTAHGLRKATARRAAEQRATQAELKALGQWSGDAQVATYVERANATGLASDAILRVSAWDLANPAVQDLANLPASS